MRTIEIANHEGRHQLAVILEERYPIDTEEGWTFCRRLFAAVHAYPHHDIAVSLATGEIKVTPAASGRRSQLSIVDDEPHV